MYNQIWKTDSNYKKEIRKEISEIKKLNLSIANQKACYIQKIYINKESESLVYHEKNNNKKDNYIGKLNLINEEYIKLYEILCKYQLISYDEPYKELDSWIFLCGRAACPV